jgi:hypothetical protein
MLSMLRRSSVQSDIAADGVRHSLITDGVFDTFGVGIVLRAGGPSAHLHVTPESRFDMSRPK